MFIHQDDVDVRSRGGEASDQHHESLGEGAGDQHHERPGGGTGNQHHARLAGEGPGEQQHERLAEEAREQQYKGIGAAGEETGKQNNSEQGNATKNIYICN